MESDLELDVADAPPRRRLRRRHVVVGTVAAAIVVVAALLVLADSGTPKRQHVAVADSSASSSTESTITTTSTTSSDEPTSSAPADSSASSGSHTTTTSVASQAGAGSSDSAPPDIAPPPPPHSFASVAMSPTSPKSGDLVTFTVTLNNRKMNDVVDFFDDDTMTGHLPEAPDRVAIDCSSNAVYKPVSTIVYRVAFRRAGAHHHLFGLGPGCGSLSEPQVFWSMDFTVADAPAPSNGPSQPSFEIAQQWGSSSQDTSVAVGIRDWDGFIDGYTIDWGDGSALQTVTRAYDPDVMNRLCNPSSDYVESFFGESQPHHYDAPGHYTVTLIPHSSGCNGADPQTGAPEQIPFDVN